MLEQEGAESIADLSGAAAAPGIPSRMSMAGSRSAAGRRGIGPSRRLR